MLIDIRVGGECALGRLAVHGWDGTVGSCEVLIRPEDLRVEPALADADDTAAGAGAVIGSVRGLSFFGADALAHVALPGLSEYVSVRVPGNARLQPGDRVSLVVTRPVSTYPDSGATEQPPSDVDDEPNPGPDADRGAA